MNNWDKPAREHRTDITRDSVLQSVSVLEMTYRSCVSYWVLEHVEWWESSHKAVRAHTICSVS